MGKVLGILQQPPDVYLKRAGRTGGAGLVEGDDAVTTAQALTDAEVEALIAERRAARAAKDFRASDRIRDRLSAAGVALEDKPGGLSEWRRK
jgi:cysteinyl-tRNA synthetase